MRNFLNLLYRYHYLLLFFLLEGIALFLLIQNNSYHRAKYVEFSAGVSGRMFTQISNLKIYFSLKETNMILAQENTALKNELASIHKQVLEKKDTMIDTVYKQRYVYFSAKVINATVSKQYNYITLNKGSKDGVKEEMAVMTPKGIVGFVNGVSENFATVLPVINRDFKISGMFKPSKFFGTLTWPGYDPEICFLNEVPHHVKVQRGDTIVTTGASSFPEGIPIGVVQEAEVKDGNFYTIKVRLTNDFRGTYYVTLVDDLLKEEQLSLEKKSKHD
jgi:rod shape-determining protein MreC